MKSERLEFLADNPHYTKRFAFYVGRRCRSTPIRDIAAELKLDWHSVKELDKQYMRAQLEKAGTPTPMAIGIDEISVGEGHDYRIVVSDLVRRRANNRREPDSHGWRLMFDHFTSILSSNTFSATVLCLRMSPWLIGTCSLFCSAATTL